MKRPVLSPKTIPYDFDIGGKLTVRVSGATSLDAAKLAADLGPWSRHSIPVPDLVVRLVPSLAGIGVTTLGPYGYSDDGCLILRSKDRRSRTKVDFRHLGECGCEISCEGPPDVGFFLSCLEIAAARKGLIMLHAAAFVYRGRGLVVTGWARGGKTSALLSFLLQGARYMTDDKVLIDSDGAQMWGIGSHVELSEWHLRSLSSTSRMLSSRQSLALRALRQLDRLNTRILQPGLLGAQAAGAAARAVAGMRNRFVVRVDPQKAFDAQVQDEARPEKFFVMVKHRDPRVEVRPISTAELLQRVLSAKEYENLPLRQHYLAWRFAFPELQNKFLEDLLDTQSKLACRALQGKTGYLVRHPHLPDLDQLFDAMASVC